MYTRLTISILLLLAIFWLEGVFPFFKGRKHRIKHAFPNIVFASLNGIISGFIFAWLIITAINWANFNCFGLLHTINIPLYIKGTVAFVLFDLWMYVWHLLNHRIFFLWRFHRVHHADLEMDTTTALRFHPGEIIFSSMSRLVVIPLLGISFAHLIIYEMALQTIILFHHSNVGLPEKWDRIFRSVIVTPNMHRVHHSQEGFEFNSNYSSIFSFWDRLNHTFRKREITHAIRYGLRIFQESKWQRLWGMLITPIK